MEAGERTCGSGKKMKPSMWASSGRSGLLLVSDEEAKEDMRCERFGCKMVRRFQSDMPEGLSEARVRGVEGRVLGDPHMDDQWFLDGSLDEHASQCDEEAGR